MKKHGYFQYFVGLPFKVKGGLTVLLLSAAILAGYHLYVETYDPLYASIEDDPCYQEGIYSIYDKGDYVRFVGYLNRARKEEKDDEATAIDAALMADIDLSDAFYGPLKIGPVTLSSHVKHSSVKGHPYIRQSILHYAGTFEGNGHTITWYQNGGNGMFVCLDRKAVVRNLTLHADSLCWVMDEYGIGMMCMVNYGTISNCQTKGNVEGNRGYTGGFAGINRGTIEDCTNRADVTLTGIGEYGAGGIAGLSKCKVLDGESEEEPIVPVIQNCVNYGTITAPWEAGGVCARNDCANIYNCGNEGDVTVQYQRGYIYPEHPDWYDRALAAGICGSMGWNFLENCYNTGKISIIEEGVEATYGIAGGTLSWVNTVAGCVSLKGTATGSMRHESVMELDEKELKLWQENPEAIPYAANNWQFDLDEAVEKLSLLPLSLTESPASTGKNAYLCEAFCILPPEGCTVKEIQPAKADTPYALCIESQAEEETGQMWILHLSKRRLLEFTKDAVHDLWTDISGSHWLHPGYSYADDCHMRYYSSWVREQMLVQFPALLHYRDDYLAGMAVGYGTEAIDNKVVLPLTETSEEGLCSEWLLLFTDRMTNCRPDSSFVESCLNGFHLLPAGTYIMEGDTLSSISRACTGDAARYPELADYNDLSDANDIKAGQVLWIPDDWLL